MSKVQYTNTPIKCIGKVVTGKTPKSEKREFYDGPYMFISPSELHGNFYIRKSAKTITQQGLESIKTNSIAGKSVLVGCIGWDMGNIAMCDEICATNQQINSITDFKPKYNPHYVFYWLSTKKEYLFSIASVTRTPILSKSTFEEIEIPLPLKSVQDDVANVLTALDEKIALNNRIITGLEAMAKTIYDYWFVQFDFPNAEGKPYRQSGGEMVYNETLKREIPKGWHDGQLQDIANITMGQSPEGESYNEANVGLSFFQGRTDFGVRFPSVRMYTSLPTRFAKCNDILLSVRAPVGDVNIALETCCIGRGLAALNSKKNANSYLFYLLLKLKPIFDILNNNGTTFGALTKDVLNELAVLMPNEEVILQYETIVSKLDDTIKNSAIENIELTRLRDWLLPMLMNGQATVE